MAGLVSAADRDEMAIPSYLHHNPLLRWMAWRRLDEIAALIRSMASESGRTVYGRLMDFGCGTGVLFDELLHVADEIIGVDLELRPAGMLVDEWQLRNIRLLTPDVARRELADDSLDAIVAAEVLEHIDPLDDTLHFFRGLLRKGGKLFVSVPTENALYRLGRRIAGFDGHYHESNAEAIHMKIVGNGFRAVRLSKIPAPGPLAIYWVAAYEPE